MFDIEHYVESYVTPLIEHGSELVGALDHFVSVPPFVLPGAEAWSQSKLPTKTEQEVKNRQGDCWGSH